MSLLPILVSTVLEYADVPPESLTRQTKPGLGCLRYLMKMMYLVAEGVIKDGFMDVPDHMHGAVMYSRNFKLFNPAHEGVLRAILRDAKGHSLGDISWGMITGSIIDTGTGQPQVTIPPSRYFRCPGA